MVHVVHTHCMYYQSPHPQNYSRVFLNKMECSNTAVTRFLGVIFSFQPVKYVYTWLLEPHQISLTQSMVAKASQIRQMFIPLCEKVVSNTARQNSIWQFRLKFDIFS